MLSTDLLSEEIVESDVELDNSELVEPDYDPPQQMGSTFTEVNDKTLEASQALMEMAMKRNLEEKLDQAISYLTSAIMLNPKCSELFASRASIFVKMKKPNAAIRDTNAALKMNADSAKGYKYRGMARAQLGFWEESAKDLRMASKLDFDEETSVMLIKIEPNVTKLEEHRQKYERLRKQNEQRKVELEKKMRQDFEAAASVLKDGQITEIKSLKELDVILHLATLVSRLAILYFTASWCGPCQYISPVYSRLAAKYPKLIFLKADIDEAMDVAAKWNIASIPCFFFVRNGKEIDRINKDIDKLVQVNKNPLELKIIQHKF